MFYIAKICFYLSIFLIYIYCEEIRSSINKHNCTITSSSTLSSKKDLYYSVVNLLDNDPKTAWVEGVKGSGKSEWIKFQFEEKISCEGFWFIPGYTKNYSILKKNVLPQVIDLYLDGELYGSYTIHYAFNFDENENWCVPDNKQVNFTKRLVLFNSVRHIKEMKFVIKGISDATKPKYEDCAISELHPELSDKNGTTLPITCLNTIYQIVRNKDFDNLKCIDTNMIEKINFKRLMQHGVMFNHFNKISNFLFYTLNSQSDLSSKVDRIFYREVRNVCRVPDRPIFMHSRLYNFFNESYNGIAGSVLTVIEKKDRIEIISSPTIEINFQTHGESVSSAIYPHFEIDMNGYIIHAEEWNAIRYYEPFCIDLPINKWDLR